VANSVGVRKEGSALHDVLTSRDIMLRRRAFPDCAVPTRHNTGTLPKFDNMCRKRAGVVARWKRSAS